MKAVSGGDGPMTIVHPWAALEQMSRISIVESCRPKDVSTDILTRDEKYKNVDEKDCLSSIMVHAR